MHFAHFLILVLLAILVLHIPPANIYNGEVFRSLNFPTYFAPFLGTREKVTFLQLVTGCRQLPLFTTSLRFTTKELQETLNSTKTT